MNTLVLGIGNTHLQDGGVGVHVAHCLQATQTHQFDINYLDGGTLRYPLSIPICHSDNLVVIDSAELYGNPGTISILFGYDMDLFISGHRKRASHEAGLAKLFNIIRLTDDLPHNRALISIQPKIIAWGDSLSDEVFQALPTVCHEVIQLVHKWDQ